MDKVVAPIEPSTTSETNDTNGDIDDNNTTTAMNEEEPENPIWSIVAPRQKLASSTNGSAAREEQTIAKAPPVQMFRPQQLNANQCIQCQKTLQEKEQLQTSDEDTASALKDVTKEKRKLEEEVEKLRLELEVMKMKIDSDNDNCEGGGSTALQHEHGGKENSTWQPTTPAPVDLATETTTPAAIASSSRPPTNSNEIIAASHQHPTDEMAIVVSQVVAAAFATADTRAAPSFIWEKRSKLFERCSAEPKKSQKKNVNLERIIKLLKKDPELVNIRSGNMPPLPDGYTLLHAAVHAGNREVVEYLLKEYIVVDRPSIDLNERDLQGRTALHICAVYGHTDLYPVLERAYKDLEAIQEAKKNEEESDGEDDEGSLVNAMDKLDTTPVTPAQQTKTRSKPKQKSRSPKPPSSCFSPKFSGPAAPIDLAGRTPLGYAATSPMPKARNNRALSEKILFKSGDRSVVGERTPPRERSGGLFTPPRQGGGGKKVGFLQNSSVVSDGDGESGDIIVETGLTSYLSPTPRKPIGRKATPFHSDTSLSSAVKAIPEEAVTSSIAWGAAEMNGFRIDMEDAILCQYPLEVPPNPLAMNEHESAVSSATVSTMGIFGVFDGHGDGGFASQFISSKLISKLQSSPDWNVAYHEINSVSDSCTTDALETIFTESYYDIDADLKNESSKPRDGGTTAIVALVSSHKILVANVGDSRCILVKKRSGTSNDADEGQENDKMSQIEVIPMSEDHKPDLPDERARIESAGLEIHTDVIPPSEDDELGQYESISKVKKSNTEMLGVARAFGDYDYKSNEDLSPSRQAVVCTPDIVIRDRADSDDLFLILACDGVWDVMSNDEVGLFVIEGVNSAAAALAKEYQPAEAEVLATVGDRLLDECLKKGSTDNMSVLIVALPASGLSFIGNAAVTARALAFE